MKLSRITRTVCLAVTMAMLAALAPVYVSADTGGVSQVITAFADTYIRQANTAGGTNAVKNFSTADSMYFNRNGGNADKARYGSWPMVQFDLSEISVPAGMQIDTVKITMHLKAFDNDNNAAGNTPAAGKVMCYIANTEPEDYSTVTWASYAAQLGNSDQRMAQSPSDNGMALADTVILCPENTLTPGDAYDYDVSEFVKSNDRTGKQSFVFYPYEENYVNGYFYSLENGDDSLVPAMTVTFKEGEAPETQTLTALDTMWTGQYGSYTADDILSIQHNGSAASNRLAYVMFDLQDIKIPEGKVIKSAALQLYVSANYYYSDYGEARNIRIANIDNDNWIGPECAWEEAPGTVRIRGGESGDGVSFSGIGAVGAVNEYYSFDVTEYCSNQYYTDKDFGMASFAVYPDERLKRKNGSVAAVNIHGQRAANPPKLVITYGSAADLEVKEVAFSEESIGMPVTELSTKGTITFANIAMSGAGDKCKDTRIFIAEYNDKGALLGVKAQQLDVYSADGTFTVGYYPGTNSNLSYTKVFVWSPQLSPVLVTAARINTAAAAE